MITQVKDFISTIVADVRTSTYVQGKVDSGKWLSGAPYYYHGTPIEINNILSKLRKGKSKFPAVLLYEPITMGENDDRMSNVGATPQLEIYFMNDWAGQQKWDTDDHYTNIIDDMDALKREFIKSLKKNKNVLEVSDYTTIRHAKYGLFFNNEGYKTQVFNDMLSGVQLNITVEIDKIIDGCNLFDEYNF